MSVKLIARLLLILIVIILILLGAKGCNDHLDHVNQVNDSMQFYRDKFGHEVATRQTLEGSVQDLKNNLNAKTESEKALQQEVKKYKKQLEATAEVVITTKDTSTGKPTITRVDTVKVGDKEYLYATYQDTIVKPWVTYEVFMSKDSTRILSNFKNTLAVSFVDKRVGKSILAPKKTFTNVTTLNPDTGVTEMTSFQVQQKKKYTGWKLLGAFLLGEILKFKL